MEKPVDPGYRRVVSLHLSRTLDEIGLNKLTVKKRRQTILFGEQMENVLNRLGGPRTNYTDYHFGSQTEGATTPGMKSDIDHLACCHDVNVMEDCKDWKKGKCNMLMLYEDTTPGYCRLQLLRSDVPMAREDLPNEHYTYDSSDRVILKNTMLHSYLSQLWHDRSGPAASDNDLPGIMDNDFVSALLCNTWPRQAAEFTSRRRRHGWPSQTLLDEAVSHGVFLVPVGYKLSPTESLEWRISASLAERTLMFSLNIVNIKCYAVLKILVKTFIEPQIQKCISSYHCKTALLHCMETTAPDFWREDNLLQCVNRCLEKLRAWVTELFCPQFMISGENLFAGKVTIHNRDLLLSILTKLIRSEGQALLQIKMDDLGLKLQTRLNTNPSSTPFVNSLASMELVSSFEYMRQLKINDLMTMALVITDSAHQKALIHYAYQKICLLKGMIGQAGRHECHAIQSAIPLLSCWLGSLLASFSLAHNRSVPRQAIQLMSTAMEYDVASLLKLASVFYCSDKLSKVEAILQSVEDRFPSSDMRDICKCYNRVIVMPYTFYPVIFALRGPKARAKLFAHCVRFSRHEIHCVPRALRIEMHRSVGNDIQHRDPIDDKWMILAAVDYLPFLYYMQYLTYKQLGKSALQRRSLSMLDMNVRVNLHFGHPETAWNLLGQCLEDEQDSDAAMACYRASLEIRPRNNAANWHVAILCYKLIKSRGLLPVVTGDQTKN